mgnify:CR=1 FL=1
MRRQNEPDPACAFFQQINFYSYCRSVCAALRGGLLFSYPAAFVLFGIRTTGVCGLR